MRVELGEECVSCREDQDGWIVKKAGSSKDHSTGGNRDNITTQTHRQVLAPSKDHSISRGSSDQDSDLEPALEEQFADLKNE